jgi:hypothetical protein
MALKDAFENSVFERTKVTAYGTVIKDLFAKKDFGIDLPEEFGEIPDARGAKMAEIQAIRFQGDCKPLPIPLLMPVPDDGDTLDTDDLKCAPKAQAKWVLKLECMTFGLMPTYGTVRELLTGWDRKGSNCSEIKRQLEQRFDYVVFGGCDFPTPIEADSVAYSTLIPLLIASQCTVEEAGHRTVKQKHGPLTWNTYLPYAGGHRYAKETGKCSCSAPED